MVYFIQIALFLAFTIGLYSSYPNEPFALHMLFAFCGVYWTTYLFIEAPWKCRRAAQTLLNFVGLCH
jgi:hypothetical protein